MTDATIGNQVFGVTSSNNFDGSGFAQPYVFRILVDSLGAIVSVNFSFKLRRLERTEFLLDSYVMGMRPQMSYEGDEYYIHCIYGNYATKGAVYYMKVSPDGSSTYAHKITNDKWNLGMQAAWINQKTGTVGDTNSYIGFESYWVGGL